jgi:hypothetical protein
MGREPIKRKENGITLPSFQPRWTSDLHEITVRICIGQFKRSLNEVFPMHDLPESCPYEAFTGLNYEKWTLIGFHQRIESAVRDRTKYCA